MLTRWRCIGREIFYRLDFSVCVAIEITQQDDRLPCVLRFLSATNLHHIQQQKKKKLFQYFHSRCGKSNCKKDEETTKKTMVENKHRQYLHKSGAYIRLFAQRKGKHRKQITHRYQISDYFPQKTRKFIIRNILCFRLQNKYKYPFSFYCELSWAELCLFCLRCCDFSPPQH